MNTQSQHITLIHNGRKYHVGHVYHYAGRFFGVCDLFQQYTKLGSRDGRGYTTKRAAAAAVRREALRWLNL